jgi:predicted nucleic acid-binding protein
MAPSLELVKRVLVTNNQGEYARVPALELENWVKTAK